MAPLEVFVSSHCLCVMRLCFDSFLCDNALHKIGNIHAS